jgi:hypothetical protein
LDLLLVVLLRNRDRLPLLWPPVFDHLASIIRGKGVSRTLLCCADFVYCCCVSLQLHNSWQLAVGTKSW